jgi:hypothetical protein
MLVLGLVAPTLAEEVPPATQPAEEISTSAGEPPQEPTALQMAAAALGDLGSLQDELYTIVVPRNDLEVRIHGNPVPVAAGLEARIHLWLCPCGKLMGAGQFMLLDYEVHDVVGALRQEGVTVSTIAPAMIEERPRLMIVRFQAEGDPDAIATAIKDAFSWIGPARMGAGGEEE